jgi:GNAT superfamily N-acetyltransferase
MAPNCRLATHDDLPALLPLVDAAIGELQRGFLDDAQIESSRAIMGIDTQLVDDSTYFVVEIDGAIAGCGGWSRRATLYGGDHSAGRDAKLLDPRRDPAKVRAMYTSPAFARRGVGRLVLERCEMCAAAEGFTTLELMGTMSGRPLYEAYGFQVVEEVEDASGGAAVPLVRMRKDAAPFELTPRVGKPARRALATAGYARYEQLDGVAAADLLRIHGVGPKAIRILAEELAARGFAFASLPVPGRITPV